MSPYHSIGCLVGLPDLPQEAIFELISAMTKLPLSPLPLFGPLNGHVNLGVSMPEGPTRLGQVGFLTSAYDHFTERFFRQPLWREARQYFAVRTELSPELITRINKDLQTRPEGVSARPMRRHAFYRDMKLFWRLCSKIMADHPLYYSLSFAEEWPMLKNLIGLVPPHFFQFLIKDGEEIGFCLATPDYNEVLKSESSDWSNLWRLITTRRTRRARIIYSGILPEFRGQKLIKYVRHQTLLAMYERGVREVESSYIDSKNINSLKNAESTGARASHGFKVYVLAGNDQGAHFGHH